MQPLLWTSRSLRELAKELALRGHKVCPTVLVGNYRNNGRKWREKGTPEEVNVHSLTIRTANASMSVAWGRAVAQCPPAGMVVRYPLSNFRRGPRAGVKARAIKYDAQDRYRGDSRPGSRGRHRSSAAFAEAAMPARTDRAINTDTIVFMARTPYARSGQHHCCP